MAVVLRLSSRRGGGSFPPVDLRKVRIGRVCGILYRDRGSVHNGPESVEGGSGSAVRGPSDLGTAISQSPITIVQPSTVILEPW
jgi:hypothetical protein